jgi:hypothetical protein
MEIEFLEINLNLKMAKSIIIGKQKQKFIGVNYIFNK